MNEFKRGEQIAYVPMHADGDINHEDVQFGFVTKDSGEKGVFCRYFSKTSPTQLRTVSNSELTPRHLLVRHHHRLQKEIDHWVSYLKYPVET